MSALIRPQPLPPTGSSTGFGCGPSGMVPLSLPTYARTERGDALRTLRSAADVSMGELADGLGVRASDVSDLEHGAADLTPEEWVVAFVVLANVARRKSSPVALNEETELLGAPVAHPWADVALHHQRLTASGLTVFSFTSTERGAFAAGSGWTTYLAERGYDSDHAEAVHFAWEPSAGPHQVVMLVGARRQADHGAAS